MKPLYWVTLALCIWAILTSARATKLIAGFIPVSDEYYDEYYGIEEGPVFVNNDGGRLEISLE